MSEFRKIPPKLTRDEWNALLDHGLEKPVSFIVFTRTIDTTKYYYAQYGDGADQAGKIAFSGTNASAVIQSAIDSLGVNGGRIFVKKGTYILSDIMVPFPFSPVPTDAKGTLFIQGEGMFDTILKANANFNSWAGYNGLIGYGKSGITRKVHQILLLDLTLDGNYQGVDEGEVPQPSSAAPALWSVPAPFANASIPQAPSGNFHIIQRVRFYRTPGYVTQPAASVVVNECSIDRCGQPDQSALHYDIFGGGDWAYLKLFNSEFKGCSGNYVDFSAGTSGRPCKVIFIGNVAYDHKLGGVYGLGERSVIANNILLNETSGSGIGYDAGTHTDNRIPFSIVAYNILGNIVVDIDPKIRVRRNVGFVTENYGTATFSGDGATKVFNVTSHGLAENPTDRTRIKAGATAQSAAAETASPVDAYPADLDADGKFEGLKIVFTSAPESGTDNVKVKWWADLD